jgi:hypothetical protein
MVLAMFVDAGRADLLAALAGGSLFVSPTILDPAETPPFSQQPIAEFAMGTFYLQQRLGQSVDAVRHHRRVAFYSAKGTLWQPVMLLADELRATADLYNQVFKGQLNLWTRLVLGCRDDELVVQ